MARKVLELVPASGILRQTANLVYEQSDASETPMPSKLVLGRSDGTIHPDWLPSGVLSVRVRTTTFDPDVPTVRTLVVGSGDLFDLGNNTVRIRTASDASGGGGVGGTVSDGDKVDITVSASGSVWTINPGVVTYSKIQEVTGARLLGRQSGSNGTVQELQPGFGITISGTYLRLGSHTFPSFNPPASGLVDFWDVESGVTVDANNLVSAWTGVNGNQFTRADFSTPADLYLRTYRSIRFLSFRRNSYLTSSLFPVLGDGDRTLFIVCRLPARFDYHFAHILGYGTFTVFKFFCIAVSLNYNLNIGFDLNGLFDYSYYCYPGFMTIALSRQGNLIHTYVNGINFFTYTTSNVDTGNAIGLQVGRTGSFGSPATPAFVFAVGAWSRALTQSEIEALTETADRRYATLFLPG